MTKIKFAVATVLAFGLLGGVAMAKSTTVNAKLATPVAAETQVVARSAAAGSYIWSCVGDTCTARLPVAPTARLCRALAKEVGTIVSFGDLDADGLARCNSASAAAASNTAVAQK